jgi:hypothetical protein
MLKFFFYLFSISIAYYLGGIMNQQHDAKKLADQIYQAKLDYDPNDLNNYAWGKMYVKVDAKDISPTDSWFKNQLHLFEHSWSQFVMDINHQTLPTVQAESQVLRKQYIPWVQRLMKDVKDRNLSHRDQMVEALQLQLESLQQLQVYLDKNHDSQAYDSYLEKDKAFKSYMKNHQEILN